MSPREFLDVADEWAIGSREAEWRSAVSRAYYAAFHSAIALLTQIGFVVPKGEQAHAYLWLRLSNSGHSDVAKAGSDLRALRSARNYADYDIAAPFTPNDAVRAVTIADDVIQTFSTAIGHAAVSAQITAAMRTYEQSVLQVVSWRPPATP